MMILQYLYRLPKLFVVHFVITTFWDYSDRDTQNCCGRILCNCYVKRYMRSFKSQSLHFLIKSIKNISTTTHPST